MGMAFYKTQDDSGNRIQPFSCGEFCLFRRFLEPFAGKMTNTAKKLKWAAVRLMVYMLAAPVFLSCGTFLYLVAPLTSYVFFSDVRFWRNIKNFHRIFFSLIRFLECSALSHENGYYISLPFFAPPRLSPDSTTVKISAEWPHSELDCGQCSSCCEKFRCSLLDKEKKCMSYGSIYWRYFNCGRFPENRLQLKFYKCPKWDIAS